MTSYLCFSVRFLQPYSHGRGDKGVPEWPPSPLRLFQALAAGSAGGRWNERERLQHALPALQWLEALPAPEIVAVVGVAAGTKRLNYVPDNTADQVVPAWKKGDLTKQVSRTEKVVQPVRLAGEAVFYLYPLTGGECSHAESLIASARSITHLGWGVDMVAGDAGVLSEQQAATLEGLRWRPAPVDGSPPCETR